MLHKSLVFKLGKWFNWKCLILIWASSDSGSISSLISGDFDFLFNNIQKCPKIFHDINLEILCILIGLWHELSFLPVLSVKWHWFTTMTKLRFCPVCAALLFLRKIHLHLNPFDVPFTRFHTISTLCSCPTESHRFWISASPSNIDHVASSPQNDIKCSRNQNDCRKSETPAKYSETKYLQVLRSLEMVRLSVYLAVMKSELLSTKFLRN